MKERLFSKIESYKDEMIDLQKKITSIPALGPANGGDGELERAKFLKKWIEDNIGIEEFIEVNAPDDRVSSGIRPNYVFLYSGKNNSKTIWIMTHMDIVPAGDLSKWSGDPFKAWEKDGKLYGRGVEDNQQEMVASLFALKALKELKIKPEYRVGIVLVSDEETGSKYGISYLLDRRADLFKKDDLIIVPDAGSPDGSLIEVAEKSILWFKFKVTGKQTHASTPEQGINANRAASKMIVELDSLYELFNRKDELFEPPISTFEPTKRESNVPNINTIPGEDVFYMDCRVLPSYSLSEIKEKVGDIAKEIEKNFNVKIEISYVQEEEAAPPTPPDSEVVKKLSESVEEVLGVKTKVIGIGGGTVAAEFRKRGLYAAVWATQEELAHEPDEYIIIDNMVKDAKVYANLFIKR